VTGTTGPPLGRARDLPLDAHLHTDLSPDADVPIDVHAAAAVECGIAELAITDHVDFDPRAPAFTYAEFGRRERSVREAAERWAGRVAIRFGVEITYERAREEEIRDHLMPAATREHPRGAAVGAPDIYVGAVVQQMGGEGMAQDMRADLGRVNAGLARQVLQELPEAMAGEVAQSPARGEQEGRRLGFAAPALGQEGVARRAIGRERPARGLARSKAPARAP